MKTYYIRLITILGLSIILLVQFVWLANSYNFVKDELKIKSTNMLEQAIMEETFSRLQNLPIGTKVQSRTEKDKNRNVPEFVYMQESLEQLKSPIILDSINHIYKQLLLKNNYPSECMISISKNDTIIQHIGNKPSSLFSLQTDKVPLRKDYSIVIQAQFVNPNNLFFGKMGLLLVSTTILLIFVVFCIIYQVRIISKINKISQIREDFSYAMVHDMKTPLSTIMMVQDMLESGRLDTRQEIKNKYMSIAKSETDHLFALTNKILTISKLENHKLEMNKTEVELTPIIEKLTEKFKAKAQKPVNFIISLQAKTAYADNDYLGEVLSNLIDNAIKYSKESVEINITTEESERYTILKVRDNGLGISEADQKVIFQKYERAAAAKRSRKNGASGFGLGLNFVDQVIKAHEGRIFVNSTEGEFTEFTIYLPLETPKNIHNR
ncbi:sensor histidine kinase KdpD [Bacteroides sp. ET336]|uniref:sensor histidine kinase n=1 Tax=Bacteroides sp. ET336 TaxID=2972459 RepID=UPI0021AC197F|nr:HAMP domain-containing sensor histidine kinase [Bacteroides sp. ET336]MCR8893088.1 HAMP domain-containing histidine kinase [Bacteroides sp. ET336]MDN0057585.1 HAMP domain-containing sensor histidine kinase [Bacteroides caecigallinarum]